MTLRYLSNSVAYVGSLFWVAGHRMAISFAADAGSAIDANLAYKEVVHLGTGFSAARGEPVIDATASAGRRR